jgi:SAM-dependent methyltransferase
MTLATAHWDKVYESKDFDAVSWYAPHLQESLRRIEELCPDKTAAIVDIGGGESTLVDDLLGKGYRDVSVLDISSMAIEFTKQRLGNQAAHVRWCVGDITRYDFGAQQFDVWHDRAVFHFLTDSPSRAAYVALAKKAVKKGGFVIVATFGPEGPEKCSGLDVVRYSQGTLHGEFGGDFELLASHTTEHGTPGGSTQQFLYCCCKLT